MYVVDIKGVVGDNFCCVFDFLLFGCKFVIVDMLCDFVLYFELIEVLLKIDGEVCELLCDIFVCYGFKIWLCEVENVFVEGGGVDVLEGELVLVIVIDVVCEYDMI